MSSERSSHWSAHLQKLHDLLVVQVGRQSSDVDLVGCVGHGGADHSGDVHRTARSFRSNVV